MQNFSFGYSVMLPNLMTKLLFILPVQLALLVTPAGAYPPDQARTNLASEYAECAAYYGISVTCLKNSGQTEASAKFADIMKRAMELSVKYSDMEVTKARVTLSSKDMTKRTAGDCARISILMADYMESCKAAVEDPQSRFDFWRKKNNSN